MRSLLQLAPAIALTLLLGCSDDTQSSGGSSQGGEAAGGDTSAGGTANSGGEGSGAAPTGGNSGNGGAPPGMCDSGPLAAPLPNCTPTPLASTGDLHQDCVDRINQFRWECQCLPPLARWTDGEACTDQQAADDQASNTPHGNFPACGENAQNTCPNWGSEQQVVEGCLQMMWDEGPGEPFSEHGHYINMSSQQYSKVACGFSSSNQGVWSNQNFAP